MNGTELLDLFAVNEHNSTWQVVGQVSLLRRSKDAPLMFSSRSSAPRYALELEEGQAAVAVRSGSSLLMRPGTSGSACRVIHDGQGCRWCPTHYSKQSGAGNGDDLYARIIQHGRQQHGGTHYTSKSLTKRKESGLSGGGEPARVVLVQPIMS